MKGLPSKSSSQQHTNPAGNTMYHENLVGVKISRTNIFEYRHEKAARNAEYGG
jgi:hypothetical protein